jgi:hypothetical protein
MGPAIYKIFHNHKEKVGEFPIPPHSQITEMITKNKYKISAQYKLRVCKGCVTSLHDVI